VVYCDARLLRPSADGGIAQTIMQTQTEENVITQKTRELCQAILDQPMSAPCAQRVAAFEADDKPRGQL